MAKRRPFLAVPACGATMAASCLALLGCSHDEPPRLRQLDCSVPAVAHTATVRLHLLVDSGRHMVSLRPADGAEPTPVAIEPDRYRFAMPGKFFARASTEISRLDGTMTIAWPARKGSVSLPRTGSCKLERVGPTL